MNEHRHPKAATRLREWVRDRPAELTVLSVAVGMCGFFVAAAGVQTHASPVTALGVMALASPLVLAWILYDAGAPRPAVPVPGPGEIAAMSDAEFDRLLDEVERQASGPLAPPPVAARVHDDDEFAQLVADALDELPEFMRDELATGNLAVVVSDYGSEWCAYGMYCGGTVANGQFCHQILIFRDTLTAGFGDDPDELRRQVRITVRHEIAHHLGARERRVRQLGL